MCSRSTSKASPATCRAPPSLTAPMTAASVKESSTQGARSSCPTQRSGWPVAFGMYRRQASVSPPGIPCARCWLAAETVRRALPVSCRARPRCTETARRTRRGAVSERLTIVTGRTRKQAIGMHKGKYSPEHREATGLVEMNPEDMARLNIEDGGQVLIRTAEGEVELTAHAGSLPAGLVVVPLGTLG